MLTSIRCWARKSNISESCFKKSTCSLAHVKSWIQQLEVPASGEANVPCPSPQTQALRR